MILVADDEQAIRELVVGELTAHGYQAVAVPNGAEAVATFQQKADDVRLFITDGTMPVLSGKEAVARIRLARPLLPVIFSSGEAGAGDGLKNVTFLNKPFVLEELLNAVSKSLR